MSTFGEPTDEAGVRVIETDAEAEREASLADETTTRKVNEPIGSESAGRTRFGAFIDIVASNRRPDEADAIVQGTPVAVVQDQANASASSGFAP